MKELFDQLPKTTKHHLILLDTCFIIDELQQHREQELFAVCAEHDVALTSFNVEELIHVVPKLKHVKDALRRFLRKKPRLSVLEIPVHPGDVDDEKDYVMRIDPFLAQDIPDPSDAVLIAAAIATQSKVITKDKHHLFTVLLKNYLHRWGLTVGKNFHDLG